MKKVLAFVAALALLGTVAVSAATGRVSLKTEKSVVEAGDTVTVVLTMNESIPMEDNSSMIQIEMVYDQNAITYVSHELGSNYGFMTAVLDRDEPIIKANWIDINEYDIDSIVENAGDKKPDRIVKEMPAGTIISIEFLVNEDVETDELVCSLQRSVVADTMGEVIHEFSGAVTITVCPGHADANDDGACDNCGSAMYVLGDADGNGDVDNADAMLVLQYFVDLIDESALNVDACDVDGSGVIDNADAMLILQYYVSLITEFPVG